jgi:hypothetical protein
MRVDFALVAYCPRCRCCEPTVAELPASALGAPLPRLQRRGQGYNFAWFGIEGSRYLRRTWLHPPVQFFQPLSHFHSVLITSTILTVRMMDFQQGQQIASQLHIHLAGDSVHLPTGHRVQCGELISKGRRLIMSQSPQPEPSSNLGATLGVVPPRKIRPRFHTRALDTFSSPGARTPVRRKSNARAWDELSPSEKP